MDLLLMKRMGWTWDELQATPAVIVDALVIDIKAESEAARIRERWENR